MVLLVIHEKKKTSPTVNLLPKTNINIMEKKMQRKTKVLLYSIITGKKNKRLSGRLRAVNFYLSAFVFVAYSSAFTLIKKILSFFLNNCLNKMSYYACLYVQKLKWHILILFEILFSAFSPLHHLQYLCCFAEKMRTQWARFLNHLE